LAVVTLLSDFGLRDPYVAEMKGVILSICPGAKIVDISHEVEKFNLRMGAFFLASAAPYFPKNTIHLAVVDPGVGTKRRAIIIETERSLYVGPDNGILILSAQTEGIANVYHITNKRYMLPNVSRTFHGRDVFAPVAAHLANNVKPKEFGPKIESYEKPSFTKPIVKGREIAGEILHIDGFGNIITNIPASLIEKINLTEGCSLKIEVGKKMLKLKLCKAYGETEKGAPLAIIGSHNFLELSVNMGNASEKLGIKQGELVKITPVTTSH